MSRTYTLIYDTLEENGISAGEEFLEWPIEKLHHDASTLGLNCGRRGQLRHEQEPLGDCCGDCPWTNPIQ
ncbi:hypothetical protein A7C99_3728 [Trichophyton rubrum]|uniref:Uncharacterized protein n=1 Tax=Trichophyton rubrum TaxID=5551 RepID=A0A178EZ79_TRIRU|nr:hypothetical protein HL42_5967 [Trichophyton rubrum]OAL65244.1 hypothetical protein A7C99_3728 [Trichophyton rubrum]